MLPNPEIALDLWNIGGDPLDPCFDPRNLNRHHVSAAAGLDRVITGTDTLLGVKYSMEKHNQPLLFSLERWLCGLRSPDMLLIMISFIIYLCKQHACANNMLFESSSTFSTSTSEEEDRQSVETRWNWCGFVYDSR